MVNFVFRVGITLPYVTMFVHYNEIFPTQVRAVAGNLISLSCSVGIMLIPILIDTCINYRIPIMLLFLLLSLFCLAVA